MSAYQLVLFLHLATVLVLVGGAVVARVGASQLARARRVEHVLAWMRSFRALRLVFPLGTLLLYLTGGWLVGQVTRWTSGWVLVSAAALLAIHVNGTVASASSLRVLGVALAGRREGPIPPAAAGPLRARALWNAVHVNLGMVLAVMWIMVMKSSGLASAFLVLGLAGLGSTVGAMTRSRERAAAEPARAPETTATR